MSELREEYEKHAKEFSKQSLCLIEKIIVKHNSVVIETMFQELQKKDKEIEKLKNELEVLKCG